MRNSWNGTNLARALLLAAPLALAACGSAQDTKQTYAADATDKSGGELIVTPENPDAVPVDTPDTAMTPVPDEAPAATE